MKPSEKFSWPVGTDLQWDVELDAFIDDFDTKEFNWDLGVWWNSKLAKIAKTAQETGAETIDLFPAKWRGFLTDPDPTVVDDFIEAVAARIPRSERRVADHMEPMLSHVLRAVDDVTGKPYRLYSAKQGIWLKEGDWLTVGTSVSSAIDNIFGQFEDAMARAIHVIEDMINAAAPDQGPKPASATGQLPAWQAVMDRRKRLLGKIKDAHEMQRLLPRGKQIAVSKMLRQRLAITQTYWDANTQWLVLADGVLDLNDVRENQRADVQEFSPFHWSTMALDVAWSENQRNSGKSEWLRGIEKIVPDHEVRQYLQMRYGAALIGRPGEAGKSMVWQYGVGDTGKSTVQEAIAGKNGVFDPYAYVADAEVLTQKGADRGATDRFVAYVRGKRFVIMSELDAGAQLNQGKFKTMTGGETVSGTAKYSNEVSYFFTPTLFVSSNHIPNLPFGDTALHNRIVPIPFKTRLVVRSKVSGEEWNETPPELRADEKWLSRLLESPQERAAILHWVIDGLMEFGRRGGQISIPSAIKDEQAKFVAEGDPVARIVNSLLGQDEDSNRPQWIRIYRESEWQWKEHEGTPVERMEELILARARDLKVTNEFGELSKKQLDSTKKMLHELGGLRKKVGYGVDANGKQRTGTAFARIREVAPANQMGQGYSF